MKYVIVLGKYLNDDGEMKDELIRRLDQGIKVFNHQKADYLVVTGGKANKKAKVAEATKMEEYLINNHFPIDKIIVEKRSHTTFTNAINTKKIIKPKENDEIFLVSTDYHFHRGNLLSCNKIFRRHYKNISITDVECK